MQHKTRTSLRDGALVALLVLVVSGLFAVIWSGLPSPRLPAGAVSEVVAGGSFPQATYAIHRAETRDARLMQAALNRIGYDLDAVAQGYASVPRLLVASVPPDLDRLETIGADRQRLLKLRALMAGGGTLSAEDVRWVMTLADTYDQPDADLDALVKKVDVIPPSLALAQAIEESGWGTSRIARQGNALFGQFGQAASGDWDYRNFSSLVEAVSAYARNLNVHRAYREFREIRAHMRGRNGELDTAQLAGTLHRYSERGDDYVQTLRTIIRANRLDAFDTARLNIRPVATILASSEK